VYFVCVVKCGILCFEKVTHASRLVFECEAENGVNFHEESDMWRVKRSGFPLIAGTILVAGALMAPTPGQAKGMDINDISDGGFEVRFDNGCFVAYDRYGERGEHANNCKNNQLAKADEAARSYSRSNSNSSTSASADPVPVGQMQNFCLGEASAKLNTSPGNISTLPVEHSGNKYIVRGQTPQSGSNLTTFECTFDQNGVFKDIRLANQGAVGRKDNGIP
jgi:hypothetical protein